MCYWFYLPQPLFFKGIKIKGNYLKDGSWAWIVLMILSVIGNQDMANNTESRWLLPMAGMVVILALKKKTSWHKTFISVAKFFVLFHVFLQFSFLYLNRCIRVFSFI